MPGCLWVAWSSRFDVARRDQNNEVYTGCFMSDVGMVYDIGFTKHDLELSLPSMKHRNIGLLNHYPGCLRNWVPHLLGLWLICMNGSTNGLKIYVKAHPRQIATGTCCMVFFGGTLQKANSKNLGNREHGNVMHGVFDLQISHIPNEWTETERITSEVIFNQATLV